MFEQTFKNIDDVLWKEAGFLCESYDYLRYDENGKGADLSTS